MRGPLALKSFPARLLVGSFILILLTTLSAGAPAYWGTRSELDTVAWSHVDSAERAAHSLLRAEEQRLTSLTALLAERPTLLHLLRDGSVDELASYLATFQAQANLDLLILCREEGQADAAPLSPCPHPLPSGFLLYDSRPALLAHRSVPSNSSSSPLAAIIAGRWLDEALLRQLASDTGAEHSVLLPNGGRLASSIGDVTALDVQERLIDRPSAPPGLRILTIDDQVYYARRSPLSDDAGEDALLAEVALPVSELIATRARALTILSLSTGGVALLGAIAAVWTVQRLTRPLEQLTNAAEAVSNGQLDAPVPMLTGPIEVRTLASALQRSQASMLAAMDDLAQARDWLDSLLRTIVEGVVTIDQTGSVTFINDKAAQLAGVTVEQALGRDVDDLFPMSDETGNRISLMDIPFDRSRHRASLLLQEDRDIRATRHPGERAMRRVHSDAAARHPAQATLEIAASRLADPHGKASHTALILRDLTQEESLRHLRSYFLANITHEFRTPLSALNASMELLMNEADLSLEDVRELMKPVHLSLLSLQMLIDNLLESSSIEAGRFTIRRQPVALNLVIAHAVQLVQPLLERREQSLSVSEPALLPRLMGDSARLTQVLVNLLTNASKYSPMHTAIRLTVNAKGSTLRVSVIDQGPGIPPEERENIFRRFVRRNDVAAEPTAEQYGIGLGLHVVKTTVEMHGGQVGVDQRQDGGSVFWFDLPVEAEDADA